MRRAVAHVFVDDLARPALSEKDVHHLSRVLRLRPGEVVSASDGRGGSRLCEWAGAGTVVTGHAARGAGSPGGASAELVPLEVPTSEPRPEPALTVGFALTKGEHPEWAVQKLTEAGADRIVVMVSDRCVARWAPTSTERQMVRLREVARLAAMQSRRCWLPSVEGPVAFLELANPAGGAGTGVALAVPGGAPLTLTTPRVLVGPEGGWSDEELNAVPCHVSLGPHVLRAETAAVAAGVLLAALRAGLVAPATLSAPAQREI